MTLKAPDFMPLGEPTRTSTEEVLEHRKVPGITFHDQDDGVIYYYDQPILYVAWYQDRMVVATLMDEGYEGPPESAKGWKQTLLVEVAPELLMRAYNSEVPLRALYDAPGARASFVHEDWRHNGDQTWSRQIRVFEDFAIPDSMKPSAGVHLDPGKADATP